VLPPDDEGLDLKDVVRSFVTLTYRSFAFLFQFILSIDTLQGERQIMRDAQCLGGISSPSKANTSTQTTSPLESKFGNHPK
jgi:hypothetical protein